MSKQQETSEERLQAELAQISAQLNALPFRQDNKRIGALLQSPEGKQLSQESRQHLELRVIQNTTSAVNADPEIERLVLREHELEMILWKRKDPDFYAVDGSIEELP